MHVRIQSWFPLVIQVWLNGHDILARKLDKRRIAHRKEDNAFTWIKDTRRAQRFADRLVKMKWPRILIAETIDRDLRRCQANKINCLFQHLLVHGLLAKIPCSRRWRLTRCDTLLVSMLLKCYYVNYPELVVAIAA